MKLVITVEGDFSGIAPRTHAWGAMFGEPDADKPFLGFGPTREDAVRDLLDNYDWPEDSRA
jgi:hypothetical protein